MCELEIWRPENGPVLWGCGVERRAGNGPHGGGLAAAEKCRVAPTLEPPHPAWWQWLQGPHSGHRWPVWCPPTSACAGDRHSCLWCLLLGAVPTPERLLGLSGCCGSWPGFLENEPAYSKEPGQARTYSRETLQVGAGPLLPGRSSTCPWRPPSPASRLDPGGLLQPSHLDWAFKSPTPGAEASHP